MFVAAPWRTPPDFVPEAKPFMLTIDFSKTAVGAVLSQKKKELRGHLLRLSKFTVITDSKIVIHWSTKKDNSGTILRW